MKSKCLILLMFFLDLKPWVAIVSYMASEVLCVG